MGRQQADQQPGGGAGISHVENLGRLRQPADAETVDLPAAIAEALNAGAEGTQGRRGGQNVLAFHQHRYVGLTHGHGAEHQGPVRDRLVAGDRNVSPQWAGAVCTKGCHGITPFDSNGDDGASFPVRSKYFHAPEFLVLTEAMQNGNWLL